MAKHGLWMPIYWADYLADTQHFSTFQHGAYLLLIGAYWCRGGPIPADEASVARMCRTTKDKLARYGNPVLAMFTCKDGLLHHQRIDSEILKSSERLASAKANGRAGGLAKAYLTTTTTTKEESKILSISDFGGKKVGGRSPEWNLSKFQKKLAEEWGVGWEIVGIAAKPEHPGYAEAVGVCRAVASKNGKGWPHIWPK